MAEQDLKQVMLDAITDADSLERFINGSEEETVLTRLSAEYPTLQKALKELFANSGVAGRYKTLVELQASPLLDGDYALVADDTSDNNGVYIKENGEWIKSKYDFRQFFEKRLEEYSAEVFGGFELAGEVVHGRRVNPNIGHYNVFDIYDNAKFISYFVSAGDTIYVSGVSESNNRIWIITNKEGSTRVEVPELKGSGILTIPEGGERLSRTIYTPESGSDETTSIKATLLNTKNIADVYNELKADGKELSSQIHNKLDVPVFEYNIPINPINGLLINNGRTTDNLYARVGGKKMEFIIVNVEGVDELIIENAVEDNEGFEWAFTNDPVEKKTSSVRHSFADFYGNGVLKIPEGVKYAVRTYYYEGRTPDFESVENPEMTITAVKRGLVDSEWNGLWDLTKPILTKEIEVAPIDGMLINNGRTTDNLYARVGGKKMQYLCIDVSNIDELVIENAVQDNERFEWAFTSETVQNLSTIRHSFADFYGNGVLKIPEGVKYAVRTYYYEGRTPDFESVENPEMTITAVKRNIREYEWERILGDITLEESNKEYLYAQEQIANSGLTVYKLSDFEGVDSHEKIDNAIAFIKVSGNGGILDLESGLHKRRSAILMPDNFWLYINDSTIMLEDGIHDNLFRNEGVVPNPDPFGYALELNENKNIRVFGNGAHRSHVKGPDVPYTAPHPVLGGDPEPWVAVWFGWRTLEFNFLNTKGLRLHGYSLTNSRSWGHTLSHGCHDFKIHDLVINNNGKNGDGIDVLMGCKHGEIYNISGITDDDMVALSATNGYMSKFPHPKNNRYAYPSMMGSWYDVGFGLDIEHVNIYNIHGGGYYHAVRILASGDSKIRHINISDVYPDLGTDFRIAPIIMGTGYGRYAEMGNIANINVNNIRSESARETLRLNGPLQDVWFNNIDAGSDDAIVIRETPSMLTYGDNVVFSNIRGETDTE